MRSWLFTLGLFACSGGTGGSDAGTETSETGSDTGTRDDTGTSGGTLQWVELGRRGDTPDADVFSGTVAHDAAGRPLVAYQRSTVNGASLHVDVYDGGAWTPVGGGPVAAEADTSYFHAAVMAAPDGDLFLLVEIASAAPATRVYAFDGADWTALPDLEPTKSPDGPTLAVDADGRPLVLTSADDGVSDDEHPRVLRFADGAWTQLGGDLHPTAATFTRPGDLVVRDGEIMAAIIDGGPPVVQTRLWVMRLSGDAWSVLGGLVDLDDPPGAAFPQLDLGPDGHPWVTFRENRDAVQDIHVARYDASEDRFVPVGGRLNEVGDNASYSQIGIDPSGTPFVAWREDGLRVHTYDGAAWSPYLGEAADRDVQATLPSLAIDDAGRPLVSYAAFEDGLTWHIGIVRAEIR